MAEYDDGSQVRIRGHVAEWYGVLDMPLVRQVLVVGALQETARWNAQNISVGMVGNSGILHRGK